jgi:hypothetical protein
MSNSEDQRELKQKFLRDQIIDQGYKAEDFVEYIGKKKEGGDDIDNWTYEELIAVYCTVTQGGRKLQAAQRRTTVYG